jgi:hypothetical protein
VIGRPSWHPIWDQLMAERRPVLNAAADDVVEAQAALEHAMGGPA